jgi:membrane protease subunit (stomatin/prohibitin family)
MSFLSKQFVDVIDWTEPEEGILSYRFPMEDREIQNGSKLTVRDSQLAVFVNEGRVADIFDPGLYTLTTDTLPILTYLRNWDKAFKSPFKSDVYFLSTRLQTDQKWGTASPITMRDKEFGAVRIRAYGIYAYRVGDARLFYQKVSGTVETYRVSDIEGQLRNTIVGRMTAMFANSSISFLDLAGSQVKLGQDMLAALQPAFAELGLRLESFVVENISLPEELQKAFDQWIGMTMVGDLGRLAQFQVAQAIPLAAANPGGSAAGVGLGLGAGAAMAQQMMSVLNPGATPAPAAGNAASAAAGAAGKFCSNCGHAIPQTARFCSDCGAQQG